MPATNLLLASKVVVTESPPTIQTIQGVPTAIAAFIGLAKRGPIRTPVFCTSFAQFVKVFGSYDANSNLALAAQGFFGNGGTQAWFTRTAHYTDPTNPATVTALPGTMTLKDRGGAAAPAILNSLAGPFALLPTQVLEVKFDGGSANTLTFTAAPAVFTTGAATYVLSDLMTILYQVRLPGSTSLGPVRQVTFHTADFVSIGAATALEVAAAINKDANAIGIKASKSGTAVVIQSDKRGSDARIVITGGTALTALTLTASTANGTGNVRDIDVVDASEIATLLTALPITAGDTAVAVGETLTLTGVTTGGGGAIQVTTNTTALGIFSGSLPINVAGTNSALVNTLTIAGKDPGTWIRAYETIVADATSGDATRFNLSIIEIATGNGETWPNLSMLSTDARYVEDFVNANSALVTVTDLLDPTAPQNNRPAKGTFTVWSGANDGLAGLIDSDFGGNQAGKTGLYAFDQIDNVTLLISPDRATAAMHNAMVQYCEVARARTCFAILDSPAGLGGQGIVTYKNTTAGLSEISEVAELHWPRGLVTNPSSAVFGNAATIVVPPGGHVAGSYARADGSKPGGVYEAPAGLLNNYGVLYGIVGVETDEVNDESIRDVVTPERINPICRIDGSPIHLDGHDTLKSTGDFPSIPERRGATFIEVSLKKGTAFAKHRNNDRRLRMTVKLSIEAFLLRQNDNNAFRGATPNESFYVDVSNELNPEEVVFAGQLNAKIGLATQKPTKWVVLDFTQDTRALDARLAQIASSTSTNSGA